LASKASIREFSDKVKEQCDKIDILINNAAVMLIPQRELTAEGFETKTKYDNNHFVPVYIFPYL
jgi:NAD(P)-dependent dehydrogenase (short-subunit alcohol dehydrogenase family)